MTAPAATEIAAIAATIGEEVAGPHAADVDKDARFPREAIDALQSAGLMSALVPTEDGGSGASIEQVGQAVFELGKHCASTAMIFAMHHIQVACLTRHERTAALDELQAKLVSDQLLFGSATTEKGIGGDVRSSTCCVERDGETFTLNKDAPVISYGEYSDVIFVTARRTPDSPPSDQSLVACQKSGLKLEATSTWDTLGFRGTCSPGFILNATGSTDLILADSYSDISAQTMLPTAHSLWAHVWLGIATAATQKAREFVRAAARRAPGTTPPGAIRLADLMAHLQQFQETANGAARRFDEIKDDRTSVSAARNAILFNGVKVSASTLVVEIVSKALMIVGIAGYRDGGKFGLGLQLRDSYGGALMVNNDRIALNTAQMLLVTKG